jgi:hypothetical protein
MVYGKSKEFSYGKESLMKMQENTTQDSLSVSNDSDIFTPYESSDYDETQNGNQFLHMSQRSNSSDSLTLPQVTFMGTAGTNSIPTHGSVNCAPDSLTAFEIPRGILDENINGYEDMAASQLIPSSNNSTEGSEEFRTDTSSQAEDIVGLPTQDLSEKIMHITQKSTGSRTEMRESHHSSHQHSINESPKSLYSAIIAEDKKCYHDSPMELQDSEIQTVPSQDHKLDQFSEDSESLILPQHYTESPSYQQSNQVAKKDPDVPCPGFYNHTSIKKRNKCTCIHQFRSIGELEKDPRRDPIDVLTSADWWEIHAKCRSEKEYKWRRILHFGTHQPAIPLC